MYRYLHLHKCANTPKKYMHAHHTHIYTCSLSHKCTITHTRTDLFMHSFTHPFTHSVIHSLTRSHIFTLFSSHSFSLFITSMLIKAHSHMFMHIHTLTHNYIMYTRTDSIIHSYNLILSYIHSQTHAHTRTHTHTVCMCICKFGYACASICTCDYTDDVTLQSHDLGGAIAPWPPPSGSAPEFRQYSDSFYRGTTITIFKEAQFVPRL